MTEARAMRIGELAGELGLNPRTIRYYEVIGLLPQPERTGGNYRAYDHGDLDRLRFIRAAKRLGLTLDEIREVLAFAERGEPPCGFVRERLHREVAAIEARIAELRAMRGHRHRHRVRRDHPDWQPAAGGGRRPRHPAAARRKNPGGSGGVRRGRRAWRGRGPRWCRS
ncbi:MAG: heavy metal-responsive transcriptional regulator [Streptosporangiaceae bacterium]